MVEKLQKNINYKVNDADKIKNEMVDNVTKSVYYY